MTTPMTDRAETQEHEMLIPLPVRLTPELNRRLRERAKAEDRSLASTMRQALGRYLEEPPT